MYLLNGERMHDVSYMLQLLTKHTVFHLYFDIVETVFVCISAQSFKEFSQLLNTVEEERRRLVRMQFLIFWFIDDFVKG